MSPLKQLIKEVLEESAKLAQSEQRMGYEAYVSLTELRQTLAEEVQNRSSIAEEDRALLWQISQYDEVILRHMRELMEEAALGIQRINGSRKQKEGYGYTASSDSIMFDKGV